MAAHLLQSALRLPARGGSFTGQRPYRATSTSVIPETPRPHPTSAPLEEISQRAEWQIEILGIELELGQQLLHPVVEFHEGSTEPLNLLVRQGAFVHQRDRLPLHHLSEELHDGQDELGESAPDVARLGVSAAAGRPA